MVKIPIILRLKKESYRNIAKAQDIIVEEVYKIFERAVLHGGTAIWRCYSGNRFSEDLDFYIPRDLDKIKIFFENLKKRGFLILKEKINNRSIFSNLQLDRTMVRFEATFKEIKGIIKDYETVDGNLTTIHTLALEEIIKEKIDAYLNRAKIRDIYDIFFLLRYIDNKDKIKNELKMLITNFRMPSDPKELKILIIDGLAPSTKDMLHYIRRII